MRAAISLITATAFWLHILLGCCAHHAHAVDGSTRAFPFSLAEEVADHGHSHGHSVPDSDTPQHPRGSHDDCHESHCTFLVTGTTTVVKDPLVAALPAVTFGAVVAQAASSSIHWILDTGDHLRLPVRLHLFNQVLLI
jgi:hypothetical protein